ncbi:MAG: hypothetical protein Q7S59_05920 [Sulfurimonas sp.]|nr:hypothetical protein [Sulfurimonas sp.]
MTTTLSDESFTKYLKSVDTLIALKKDSQKVKNEYGDTKSINVEFGSHKFNVMDKSVTGFSVVIANNDVSIALRKTKNKINPSPVIKVEFRAEFLARKGYVKAIAIVNSFIADFFLDDSKVKISEIHLATDIQGYHFTHLDFFRMKTRSRNSQTHQEETDYSRASAYGSATTFSGFSFGGGDYHMRIYNKTLEINKFKNKGFAQTLLWEHKPNYNPNATVWRLEIQIRRNKLKKLVNSDGSTMDDYNNILNGIPDLWNKALTDFRILDVSDSDTFDMLRGKRTLKNGSERLLSKNAIRHILKKADSLPFWSDLKIWNTYCGKDISTAFNIPKSGSFDYVSNSIKSLYSTMAKHYGSVDSATVIQAFKEANEQNFHKKQISLIEDSFNKQLDWFERIEYLQDNGVCNLPMYKALEANIYTTVEIANSSIHANRFSSDMTDRLFSRLAFPANQDKHLTSEASSLFINTNTALHEADKLF